MKDNSQPFISVIIPTRERAETLKYAIKTALNQKSNAFEVIVSDNFSQDNTREIVESFSDPRLRYVNTGRRLSMCDSYEFGLEHAVGRYAVIIGDDDAVMPGALDKLEKIIETNPCPIYTWPKGVYVWPIAGQNAVAERLPKITPPFELDLKKLAHRAVRQGFWGYSRLPSIYHSAIAKEVVDEMRRTTGRIFHSTQPDLFTGFAFPAFASKAINLGFSVTLHGRSAKANGGVSVDKKAIKNIELYVKEFGDYRLHPTLYPSFPGMANHTNLLPDSLLLAIDKFPQVYGGVKFNYEGMWTVFCLNKGMQFGVDTWGVIRQSRQIRRYHPFSLLRFFFYLIMYKIYLLGIGIMRRPVLPGPFREKAPDNIHDFVQQLSEWQAKGNCDTGVVR